jgi:hypothetical protein
MPEGNRDRNRQIRLTLAAAFVAGVLLSLPLAIGIVSEARYQHYAANETTQYASYADQKASQSCRGVPAAQFQNCLAEARIEAELEKRSYKHDQTDLIAQRKAALWAQMMGVAALIGMWLSIVGIVFLWVNYLQSQEANRISRQTAELQLRPYVYIGDEATLDLPFGPRSKVKFTVKNYGYSPAMNLKLSHVSMLVKRPIGDQGRNMILPEPEPLLPVLGPQSQTTLNMHLSVFGSALKLIENGTAALISMYKLTYEGNNGVSDSHEISVYIDRATLDDGVLQTLNDWARERSHIEGDDGPSFDLEGGG